jgi:hypothetical protein
MDMFTRVCRLEYLDEVRLCQHRRYFRTYPRQEHLFAEITTQKYICQVDSLCINRHHDSTHARAHETSNCEKI